MDTERDGSQIMILPMIPAHAYGAVLADPPWRFETYSDKGLAKSAQSHYRCEMVDDLVRIGQDAGIDWCCAEDCALVMWATWPMLPQAMFLMESWGFGN